MTALLRLLPPRRSQFRPRRATPSGAIVVHTAENTPDFVGPDGGAENVARFIQSRTDPGSYHRLVDTDSIIELVDFEDEAFHDGTGGNRWSIGISAATRADAWNDMPQARRVSMITKLAEAAAEAHRWLTAHGHPGCPPKRITRADYRNKQAGFISHAELDPGRRTDPGPDFPWDDFLDIYARLTAQRRPGGQPATVPDIGAFMLRDFIDDAYHQARGYSPFGTGRDLAGALYWLRTAAAENPDASWTWQDCLDSPTLGVMVALLLEENAK